MKRAYWIGITTVVLAIVVVITFVLSRREKIPWPEKRFGELSPVERERAIKEWSVGVDPAGLAPMERERARQLFSAPP